MSRKMDENRESEQKLILYADHNPDDRLLVKQALDKTFPDVSLVSVANGEELLEYLSNVVILGEDFEGFLPDAILLELNLPKKSGTETLAEIKSDRRLQHIPVIIFSTSTSNRDIENAFRLGASTFIRKPRSFQRLIAALRTMSELWSETEAHNWLDLAEAS